MSDLHKVPIEIIDRAYDSFQREGEFTKSLLNSFLEIYVRTNRVDRVENCLKAGADPNSYHEPERNDVNGEYSKMRYPILSLAYKIALVNNGDFRVPETILAYNPDVNQFIERHENDKIIKCGNPLFLLMSANKDIDVTDQVSLLVQHGADVNIKKGGRWTPLSDANTGEKVHQLVKFGADINYVTNDKWGKWNLLMIQVFNNNERMARWLLEEGINVDFVGKDDYLGSISGTPYSPVDIFDFLAYINTTSRHEVSDPILEHFNRREEDRMKMRSSLLELIGFPEILVNKVVDYCKHPKYPMIRGN